VFYPAFAMFLQAPFFCTSMFIRDDFPTLERPINANSGLMGIGNLEIWVLLQIKSADLMIMPQR
jgi:hypothetical protein